MKKSVFLFSIILCLPFVANSQNNKKEMYHAPMIGEQAPKFKAESTQGILTFPNDFKSNWKVLFSHPADFTPVCTSELLELANMQEEFAKIGTNVAIISTDLLEHHELWVKSMEELTYKDKETAKINFPLFADPELKASMKYGMIHPSSGTTKNVRGVFIIDPENTIRSILFYPMAVGRNMEEIQRTVMALQKHDADQVLTPANWTPGQDVIVPFPAYTPELDQEEAKKSHPESYSVSWYLHLKKDQPMALK